MILKFAFAPHLTWKVRTHCQNCKKILGGGFAPPNPPRGASAAASAPDRAMSHCARLRVPCSCERVENVRWGAASWGGAHRLVDPPKRETCAVRSVHVRKQVVLRPCGWGMCWWLANCVGGGACMRMPWRPARSTMLARGPLTQVSRVAHRVPAGSSTCYRVSTGWGSAKHRGGG
jgi:hypothetical protein